MPESSPATTVATDATKLDAFSASIDWARHSGAQFGLVAFERDGELHNLACRLSLLPAPPDQPRLVARGHGLLICRGWIDANAARTFLADIARGPAVLDGHKLRFQHLESGRSYQWLDAAPLGHGIPRIGWSAQTLQGSGSQIGQVLDPQRIEWLGDRLVALEPDRFTSWDQIEKSILGPGVTIGHHYAATIEIFDTFAARIGEPSYVAEKQCLAVPIICPLDPLREKMELIFSLTPQGLPVAIPASQWRSVGPGQWEVIIEASAIAGRIDLHLIAAGSVVWKTQAILPALSARLLDALENSRDWLRRLLSPDDLKRKSSASGFERGIVALLALGGIPAIPFGEQNLDGYFDVLACDGRRDVVVVECTIGSPAPKKLADLRARTQVALSKIKLPEEDLTVRACLFTPLGSAEIAEQIHGEADRLGIVFICKERLALLHEAALAGDLAERFWHLLDDWEPPSPDAITRLKQLNRKRSASEKK